MTRWIRSDALPWDRAWPGIAGGLVATVLFGIEYLVGLVAFDRLFTVYLLLPGAVAGAVVIGARRRHAGGTGDWRTDLGALLVAAVLTAALVALGGLVVALGVGADAVANADDGLGGLALGLFLFSLTSAAGVYVALVAAGSVLAVSLVEYLLLRGIAVAYTAVTTR